MHYCYCSFELKISSRNPQLGPHTPIRYLIIAITIPTMMHTPATIKKA